MRVAAHAQQVEQALPGPGGDVGLGRHHQPADRDDAQPEQRGRQQDAGRLRGDAAVDGEAGDVGERQRAERIEGDEGDAQRQQPADRPEQPAEPAQLIAHGRVGCGGVGGAELRDVDGGGQLRHRRHQPGRGRQDAHHARRAHARVGGGRAPGAGGHRLRPQLGGDAAQRRTGRSRRPRGRAGRIGERQQLPEQRRPRRQLRLGADVDHAPGVEHGHAVGQGEGGSAVGDEQRGAALRQHAQRLVDGRLGGGVDRGGGVVEHEDPRVGEHRAGQGDALALPARQREPALADEGVVAVGELVDERVHLGRTGRGADLLVARVGAAVGDVGADAVGEQERLLEHHAQLAAQVVQAQVPQRHATEAQLAGLRVVEARQQQRRRGLAGAGRAHERERLPRLHPQRHVVEHRLAAGVAERDVVELHGQRTLGQGGGGHRIDDVGVGVDQVVHALHAGPRELCGDHQRAQQPGRADQPGHVGGEREERAQRDRAVECEVAADGDDTHLPERGQREQGGVEPGGHPGGAQPLGEQPLRAALQRRDLARLLPEALHHPHAGDGLLDLLRDVGGPLLRRPGGREQGGAGLQRHPPGQREQHQRHERERRREPQHRAHRHHHEHDRAERQRHHRQQPLQELQVGDGAGDDLPGADGVLPLTVEPLDGGEHLAAQVVLDVEGEPATQVAAQERRGEAQHREPEERHDDGHQHLGGALDGVVDGHAGEQRPDRVEADAQGGCDERGDGDAAVAHRGADEPSDPAGRCGGLSNGHGSTVCRRTDGPPVDGAR